MLRFLQNVGFAVVVIDYCGFIKRRGFMECGVVMECWGINGMLGVFMDCWDFMKFFDFVKCWGCYGH